MKKWLVRNYNQDELAEELNKLSKQGYKIFKIFKETYDYLVIAYEEIK